MVPRILPCVPLPEPGAPMSSMVRYFTASTFCVLVPDLHGLNLHERDHDFRGGVPALQLHMHFVHGNAADPFADILAAHRFNDEDEVLLRFARDHAKKAGELGFKKAPVESELASGVSLRLKLRRGGFRF